MLYKVEDNMPIIITWKHCVPNMEHEVIKDYKYNMRWYLHGTKFQMPWSLSDRIIQTEMKPFEMLFISVMTHLFLCLLYKIIGIYWSWNSDAENGLLDNLGAFKFVFIFITSWEGKYETDRLPNVFDLIRRYFAFILKSLKRIRDRCLENLGHSFIFFFP